MKQSSAGELRGALIGTGSIAEHHIAGWQSVNNAKILALVDRDVQRAAEFARRHALWPAAVYGDHRELAREQLDFVDVATPPEYHADVVIAAAQRGIPVLCQKPMALSIEDAQAMIQACELARTRLVVHENWRFRAWYRHVKELLQEGAIGQVRFARFTYHGDEVLPRQDGTIPIQLARQPYSARVPRLILLEWGIHLIDVLSFLIGPVESVFAETLYRSPLVAGDDGAIVTLRFENGAVGLLDISWATPIPAEQRLQRGSYDPLVLVGDRGVIRLDRSPDDTLTVTDADGNERLLASQSSADRAAAYQASFDRMLQHFIDCLRSGDRAETEAQHNLPTLATTLAAYQSAERRTVVNVRNYLDQHVGGS